MTPDAGEPSADTGGREQAAPSDAGGSAGSNGGAGSTATGGNVVIAAVAGAGAGAVTADVAPVAQHSRECILDRLARPASAPEPSGAPPEVGAGGASGAMEAGGAGGEAAIDLGLGAGDLTVLVVFDKSGSMGEHWDDRTRWEVANDAFMKAIEGVLDNLTLGAIFFPEPGGCEVSPLGEGAQVELARGRDFYDFWQSTLESRRPDGSTPLERAFVVADSAIERGCRLGLLSDRFRVLLVTDGEPTCNDDPSALVKYAEEWSRLGVETWVMGIPGSTRAADLLDAIARAGGTERHQSLGDPSELDDRLYTAVR